MAPHDAFTPAISTEENLPTSPVMDSTPSECSSNTRSGDIIHGPTSSSTANRQESSPPTSIKPVQTWPKKVSNWLKERWGWIVTFATFVILLLIYGFLNCYALLFVAFRKEFNSGATATGWIGSFTTAVAHFAGPLTNYLVHKLRSPRLVVFMGILLLFVGLIISSFVDSIYYLFVTIGVLVGVGINMAFQSSVVLVVQYFPDKHSSRAVSIACSGCSIGMLILSPIVNYGLETIGWRATLRYVAGGILFIGSLCSLPMLPVGHKTRNMQRQFSLLHEVNPEKPTETTSVTSKIENAGTSTSNEGIQRSISDRTSQTKQQKNILRSGKLWVLISCMLITSTSQIFYNINYVSYLKTIGVSSDSNAIMITLYAAGQISGELALSVFVDKLPCQKSYIIAISSFLCGVTTIPILFVSTVASLKGISVVLGILRASRTVLVIPTAVEIFGVSAVQQVTSAVMIAHGVGFICGSLVMGLTFDRTGSYDLSISICIALLGIACFLYLSIPLHSLLKRRKLTKTDGSEKSLHQAESASVQDEEECHILPIPNLVAPVGDVVPILVASQESLNCIEHVEVHEYLHYTEDQWEDFETGRYCSPDLSESPSRLSLHGFQSPKGSIESNDLSHPINVEGPLSDDLIMRLNPEDEVKAIECCNSSSRLLDHDATALESCDHLGTDNDSLSANLEHNNMGYINPEIPICEEDGLVMWMDPGSTVKYTSKYEITKPKGHRSSRNCTVDPQAILQRLSSLGESNPRKFTEPTGSSLASSQVTPDDDVSSTSMTPRSWKLNDETISETSSILQMSIKSLTNMSKEINECIKNDEDRLKQSTEMGVNVSVAHNVINDHVEQQSNDLSRDAEASSHVNRHSDANIVDNPETCDDDNDEGSNVVCNESSKVMATGFANPMSEAFEDLSGSPSCVGSPKDSSGINTSTSNVVMDTHGTQTVIYQSNIQHEIGNCI